MQDSRNDQLKRSYKPQTHQIYSLNALTCSMVTSGRTSKWLLTTWTQHFCHADSNSTLGGWIFHPSSRQDVKQDTVAVLLCLGFLTQKAISVSGEELPRQTALSFLSSLLAMRFAANIMKVKGQFLVFTSSIIVFQDWLKRLYQEISSLWIYKDGKWHPAAFQMNYSIFGCRMSSCSWNEGLEWGVTSLSLLLGQSFLWYLSCTQ